MNGSDQSEARHEDRLHRGFPLFREIVSICHGGGIVEGLDGVRERWV
jgi:hypothetical protein